MRRAGLLAIVLATAAACKGKAKEEPAARASAPVADQAPVLPPLIDAAAPAPAAEPTPLPSATLIASGLGPLLLAGPALTADGKQVVWCTQGGDGMSEWVETICHLVAPGKKPVVIPVMTLTDAMAVDEGVDPAGDADAGVKAATARDHVAAAVTKLTAATGADLKALPKPVRCSFADGEFTGRDDGAAPADPRAEPDVAAGCVVGGITASLDPQGKLLLVSADKILFTEVFKPRPRGKGEAGLECALEASVVALSVDPAAKLAAVAISMTNPSDTCALVTELEVRALRY